ncbi:hypothetical protein [Gracilibacillus sp. YIM 98692]|uniref:hypothetical protein n=1 Tax=Gracilibacillus sp. YIM 98692 TaxID=2663532 RepID=UPI0013D127FA|nr:hypothetical protein [Gracilibacillus sp. YIM 98692]
MNLSQRPFILICIAAVLIVFSIGNPTVLAKAKNGVAHIVEELEERISKLEEEVANIETSSNGEEPLSEELQKDLLEHYEFSLDNSTYFRGEKLLNIVNYGLVYENGANIFRVYLEGDYFWEQKLDDYSHNQALHMATMLAGVINQTNTLYDVDVSLEIYDDGERVRDFASR